MAQSTVAGGGAFSLIVESDGSVWSVGLNNNGQLGDNSLITRKTPIQITGLSGVLKVAAGSLHAMALTSGGTVYAWGDNLNGQVGDGSTTDRKLPVALGLTNIVSIAAGEFHSVALGSNGDVYVWGKNVSGLGDGTTTMSTTPIGVLSGVVAIGAGKSHTLAVKTDGTVWAWGLNTNGQLGDGTITSPRTTPVQVSGITTAVAVAAGDRHSIFRLAAGTLTAVGDNGSGQLGDATIIDKTTPISVPGLIDVSAVASGGAHVLALKTDGTVWAWGENGTYGQVGTGTGMDATAPAPIAVLSGMAAIGAGADHSLTVDATGVVSTWGKNNGSQLGDGTTFTRTVPEPISEAAYAWRVATPVFSIAAGVYTSDRTVVVTIDTAGATIRYTQNGNEPTELDPIVAAGGSVVVSQTQTLKAKAWKAGMPASAVMRALYTMKVVMPTMSPAAGTYTSARTVTMSTTMPGASVRYTTDGVDPTAASTLYTASFVVGTTTTVKARGFKSGWSASDVRSTLYTMNFGTLSAPTITPATGTYEGQVSVEMSSPQPGAVIRHTTTGGTPSASSPIYTAPFPIAVTTTVKAKAFHPDYTTSAETSRVFTLTAGTPTLSLASGAYAPRARR